MTQKEALEKLHELRAIATQDPEAAHDMAIEILLQYLDQSDQGEIADAYREANKHYWAADRGERSNRP